MNAEERNVHRAREVGVMLARLGAYPVIPHSNTAHFDGEAPDELWLAGTLELMRRCDGVVLVGAWTKSSGALAERAEAERLGLPVCDFAFLEANLQWSSVFDFLDEVRNARARRHGAGAEGGAR
jgi:hypothetical protein